MERKSSPARNSVAIFVGVLCVVACSNAAAAEPQWRQWGGPNRNFMVHAEGLADKWPEDGPKKLWSRELGDGYATILVDGDVLYTQYRPGEETVEFVVAMDAATGKTSWEHKTESPYSDQMKQFGPGPSSTPLVVGDRLFAVGANMIMYCFNKGDGTVYWKKDLVEAFEAQVPGRGYCASPLAYKDTVIVPVGGEAGQALVAFQQSDGGVAWKALEFDVAHSSPVLIEFNGKKHIAFASQKDLLGVDPDSGSLLWQVPLKPEGSYLSSPLWTGDEYIFISSAYGGGSHAVKLETEDGKTVAKELWYDRKMRIHHANAVRIGDYIYGSSGDFGPAFLAALELETGKLLWRKRGFSKSTMVHADGKVILLDEDGNLALTRMTPEGIEVLSQCKIAELYAWAAPTLVGKTLYVRDRKHVMAFDLGTGG